MLSGGERLGGDLTRIFQRYWLVLYLIGRWRLTAAMELEEALATMRKVNRMANPASKHQYKAGKM